MPEVVGREAELAAVRAFVDAVAEGPSALVLEGEAGIGKTTLWSAGVELAKDRGIRVLSTRSAETETGFAFGGLLDLLGDVPEEALDALPDVQRHALEVALLRSDPGEVPVDPGTVSVAALGVLRGLASEGPVILALDDPQWIDPSTGDALTYAARRLDGEPAGILAAVRSGGSCGEPEWWAAMPEARRTRLTVGPLPEEALGKIVHQRLGDTVPGSVLLELHVASGGNPLFALEIARATLRAARDRWPSVALPSTLKSQVGGRLAAMSAAARALLLTAAAVPRPTVTLLHAAGADAEALAEAAAAGMLEVEGDVVRFTHPFYASVAYTGAPPELRSQIHRRLADLVADPEERARHLALAGTAPDAEVADALEQAAARARARGARAVAAELLLEARRFTPADGCAAVRRRAVLAAENLYELEDRRSVALLQEAADMYPEGPERARILCRLARALVGGIEGLMDLDAAEHALDEADDQAGSDPGLRSSIHRERVWVGLQRFRLRDLAKHADRALDLARRAGAPEGIAISAAMTSFAHVVAGEGVRDDLIEEAMRAWREASGRAGSGAAVEDHPALWVGMTLLQADRLDGARDLFETMLRDASERGSPTVCSLALSGLVDVAVRSGDIRLASRLTDEMVRLGVNDTAAGGWSGSLLAYLGRAEEARSVLTRALEDAEAAGWMQGLVLMLGDLGFLELSLGDLEAANVHLARATEGVMGSGTRDPGICLFLPDAVETLVGLGDLAEADRLTDWLEERGSALNRPRALATGARCRGLLLSAKGDHEGAIEHLERAMVEHERLPLPFERARTLLVLGGVRRRADHRRAAREALTEALETFERLGAVLWADKARAELASVGGRATGVGELTPMESRVAHLAAAGRTNREIAVALFLSVRTVESHLSHTYRKLGVRSRTELAHVLADGLGP